MEKKYSNNNHIYIWKLPRRFKKKIWYSNHGFEALEGNMNEQIINHMPNLHVIAYPLYLANLRGTQKETRPDTKSLFFFTIIKSTIS